MSNDRDFSFIQLVDKYQLGGAEQVAITYNKCLFEMGYKCQLVGIEAGIKSNESTLCKNYFSFFYRLFCKILMDNNKVVLISHTTKSFLLGVFCRILFPFKVKLLFVQHLNHNEKKVRLLSKLAIFCNKYIQITPITERLSAQYIPVNKRFYFNNFIINETLIATNVVNLTDEIKRNANGRKIITFIGAMRKKGKNPSHIFNLARHLPEEQFYFLIVGDGKGGEIEFFKNEMEAYSKDRHNYEWVGYQTNVTPFLAVSHYLFFSSFNDYEMMPMTVLEGLERDIPVFAYNLDICRHLLPADNIFELNDFESISDSILGNKLVTKRNEYNITYAKDKFSKLINELKI